MNENYNDCHHRKTTRTFVYKHEAQKLRNVLIYKNTETLKKARQFPLRFYIQKAIYFTLRNFSLKF